MCVCVGGGGGGGGPLCDRPNRAGGFSEMVRDHGNHKSRHLDRVDYSLNMAIYGVPAFDNFDSQYFDP